jgi:hypothetical protein
MKKLLLFLLFLGVIQSAKAGLEIQQITVTPINVGDINIHTKVADGYYFEYFNHTYNISDNTITLTICYAPFLTPVGTTKENDFVIPNINVGVNDFTLIVQVNKRMWTGTFWTCENVNDTDMATLTFSTPLDGAVYLSAATFAKNESRLQLYPNPTTGVVNFSGMALVNRVVVFDHLGRKMRTFDALSDRFIDLSDVDEGVYFVTLFSENSSVSRKLVVRR